MGSCGWSSPTRASSRQNRECSGSPACTLPHSTEELPQVLGTCLVLGSPLLSHVHLPGLCLLLPDLCLSLPCPPGAGGILRGTPTAWGQSASSAPPVSRHSSAPRWLPRQVGTACPPPLCAAGFPSPSRHGGAHGSGSIWLWLHMAPADSSTKCPRCLTASFLCRPSQAQASTSTEPLQDGRAPGPLPGIALCWGWCGAGTGVFRSQWWRLGGCRQCSMAMACPALPQRMCERSFTSDCGYREEGGTLQREFCVGKPSSCCVVGVLKVSPLCDLLLSAGSCPAGRLHSGAGGCGTSSASPVAEQLGLCSSQGLAP